MDNDQYGTKITWHMEWQTGKWNHHESFAHRIIIDRLGWRVLK